MNTYKVIFSSTSELLFKFSYITVEAKSEGDARGEARKMLTKNSSKFANIHAAQKQN